MSRKNIKKRHKHKSKKKIPRQIFKSYIFAGLIAYVAIIALVVLVNLTGQTT